MSTAHALKIVNMETRLKIKPSRNAIFKVTLHTWSSYVDKGVIIFVLKGKMVPRDPLTGDWYGNKCLQFPDKRIFRFGVRIVRLFITSVSVCYWSTK